MARRLLAVLVLLGMQLVSGRNRIIPSITISACSTYSDGGTSEFSFSYNNPDSSTYIDIEYNTDKFYIVVEDAEGSRKLRKSEIDWGTPRGLIGTFRFLVGYHSDCFHYRRTGTPSNPAKPFMVRFFLDGNMAELDNCHAVIPTLTGVTNNCDGSYTAHFGYVNTTGAAQILPSPKYNPENNWNFFTARTGNHVSVNNDLTTFAMGDNRNSYPVTFWGAEITWHLTGHSLTATSSIATPDKCSAYCYDNYVPMDDFFYRPYPVLLVHGYNATPLTWGATTARGSEKDTMLVSTKINSYTSSSDESHLAEILAEDIYGSAAIPFSHYKTTDTYFDVLPPERFYPGEEEDSYTGTDHTFVEHYCSSYSYEADDATDAKALCPLPGYSMAQCEADSNLCYRLDAFKDLKILNSPYGGQTQLVRMRMVQLLNEYYGDWNWLNDPTAKINIVVHSNGGLIVTMALKNDEAYYNAGKSLKSTRYYINGLGVRLRDHVNLVQTVDTPFDGSPLGDTDAGWKVKYSKWQWLGSHLFFESFLPLPCDPILGAIHELIFLPGLRALFNEHIIQEYVRTGQPISAGFQATGGFLEALKGDGKAPEYSDQSHCAFFSQEPGKKIPYVNYVGIMQDVGVFMAIYSGYPAAAFVFNILKCIPPWSPACNPCAIYTSAVQLAGGIMMSAWAFNSDLIVHKDSQRMNSIYNDTDPNRFKIFYKYRVGFETFHSSMPKTKNDEIIRQLNPDPELKFTHAIGENQDTCFDFNTTFSPPQFDTSDVVLETGNECVRLHQIGQFYGMVFDTSNVLTWPRVDSFGTVRTTLTTGKAVKLVGYIKNTFMDHLNLWVYVNNDSFPLVFYDHYGRFASRYVDRDGDNRITDNDWPGGSWFCTPDISCKMREGKNEVTLKAWRSDSTYPVNITNPEYLMATVKVICSKPLGLFEADDSGRAVVSTFIDKPMRWDLTGGQEKTVYIGITDPVTRTAGDGIKIVQEAAEECAAPVELTFYEPYACDILDPGEFCAPENPSMPGHTLLQIRLGPAIFKTVASGVTADQLLRFRFFDTDSALWSNESVPFYIDNDPVEVRLFSPPIKGDYNHDGIVDTADVCGIDNTDFLPASCDSAAVCDPAMSPEQCAAAMAICNNYTSSATVLNLSDCDGVDNDFDAAIDDDDISEMSAIEYYSPQFDSAGKLTTRPVNVNFSISDNMQARFPVPKKLEIKVYKVTGNDFNPGTDQLIFVEDRGSAADSIEIWRFGELSFDWHFVNNQGAPYDSLNPPPDGLYCVMVTGLDLAGDTGTADEITAGPAYFIVDRTPPSFTILRNWHDPQTGQPVLNRETQQFRMSYRPGPSWLSGQFPDRFDSEIYELEVQFFPRPVYGTAGQVDTGFITVNSMPVYRDSLDNDRYLNNDSNFLSPDGRIDPTTCYIEPADQWSSNLLIRHMLLAALSRGIYTVKYIAKDRAGNVTIEHDTNFVIRIERPDDFEEARESGKIDNDSGKAIFIGQDGEFISDNSNPDDGDSATDEGIFISYIPYTGPCGLIIKVRDVTSTGSSYSVLIDLRNSLAVDDISATVEINNDGYVVFSYRDARSGDRQVVAQVYVGRMTNVWLKLVRDDSGMVTAWYSLDGVNYTILGSVSFGTQVAILGTGFKQIETTTEGEAKITVFDPVVVPWTPVQPVLNGVVNNCDGTYTASFGYNNPNSLVVILPHGEKNGFTYKGGVLDVLSRPMSFETGSRSNVFTVDFDGSPLKWYLDGNTVTATGVSGPCEPVIIPSSISGYSVYGLNQVDLGDRTELICGSGKCATASGTGLGVTVGVQGKVKSIESRGQVTLRNYANCSDFIKSASTVTLQSGATCPSITQYYTFPADVLPSTMAASNIDFTGVPQTTTVVESYQTKTLAPGKYWNYTARANGKLKLSAGTYYFHDLNMENNSIIECNVSGGAVRIYIQNYYYSGATCNIVGGNASKVLYGFVGSNMVTVDKLKGTLIAPNAVITAGGWAKTFYGQLIGKKVIMNPDCKVYFLPFSE
ncbi:MAG: hypothetical protein JXA18_07345 [Chitinispirillaceae bacterium]|nr:hypothetical protein [Chitinispirillaceae bacterium]